MQVEVTYNENHDGIELSFPEKPDTEVLSQIRSHGFRWHRSGKYWYARNNPTRKAFAESLSGKEISSDIPEPEPPDGPSYEPTLDNLEARKYSYVSISYVGADGNSRGENYIIFEPLRFQAEYLAREFAKKRHGPSFERVSIYPKNYIQKARTLFKLGRIIGAEPVEENEDIEQDPEFPEELAGLKIPTDKPKQKRNARQLLNDQIEELIREKDRAGESYSVEDRELIIRYSGSGGLKIKGKDDRGTLYEYYTPDELVRYCWALAIKYGYSGGPVLEPACGTGNFLRYAPGDTLVTGYETNPVSARIAEILYPHAQIVNRPFESAFFAGTVHLRDKFDLPRYELVIGNPPFGQFRSRYGGMGEKKFTGASRYEEYFIQRGLDLLAPGGLLLYVIHQSFLNSPKNKWKEKKLEPRIEAVRDAYRLPVGTFEHTDTVTDILILQKRI